MGPDFFGSFFRKADAPLTNATIRKHLGTVLAPLLDSLGMPRHDGDFLWFSDFNQDGIRRVFKYSQVKSSAGLFSWGVCLRHVPTISAMRKLQYHWTDKNITLHLWEWPRGYFTSLEHDVEPTDIISLESEKALKRDALEVISRYRTEIEAWYKQSDTLAGCTAIADKQIQHGGAYNLRWPSPHYVKIFLLGLQGRKAEAKELLAQRSATASKGNSDWRNLAIEVEKAIEAM